MPAALHIEVALEHLEALGVHLKLLGGGGETRLPVRDVELQLDVRDRHFLVAVGHGQGAAEGLARHRHRLVNLQRDGGTGAGVFFLYPLGQLVIFLDQQVADAFITIRFGNGVGLMHGYHIGIERVDVNRIIDCFSYPGIEPRIVDALHEGPEFVIGNIHGLVVTHGLDRYLLFIAYGQFYGFEQVL